MFTNKKIGVGITGSFCSLSKLFFVLDRLIENHADIYLVFSNEVQKSDTRFYQHEDLMKDLQKYTKHPYVTSIKEAELFGPKIKLDAFLVMPATSNTVSKMYLGICDSSVLMSCKATLRNQKPVIISFYSNDGLGLSGKNWISLLGQKNIYFVPLGQDDPIHKPNSLLADHSQVVDTIKLALEGRQIQPVLIVYD